MSHSSKLIQVVELLFVISILIYIASFIGGGLLSAFYSFVFTIIIGFVTTAITYMKRSRAISLVNVFVLLGLVIHGMNFAIPLVF